MKKKNSLELTKAMCKSIIYAYQDILSVIAGSYISHCPTITDEKKILLVSAQNFIYTEHVKIQKLSDSAGKPLTLTLVTSSNLSKWAIIEMR